jgi:ABC-type Mn2+/Zn2+ transport system ATPase subunit
VHAGAMTTGQGLVRARDVATGYGGDPAVTGLDFSLMAGQRVGVLGPNGAGKTTLFRMLRGELPVLHGELEVSARCGTVPQTERSRLDYPVNALDVALMGALSRLPWWRPPGATERRTALDALDRVGLRELVDLPYGELSGGQRQRALIARALVQDARLLLLDEPFSGLDAPMFDRLMGLLGDLAKEGRGVMIATHDVEQVSAWDSVLCLNRRQIAFGPPLETLTLEVLEATYGGAIVELPDRSGEGRLAIMPPHHH